jgi:hypothetical protein
MTALTPEVISFATRYIGGLDELQVLLTCLETRERWWDAGGMARELGIGESAARRALDHLCRGNLLDIRVTGDVRYQFQPGTSELEASALACAAAYRANPLAVAKLVTDSRSRYVRDFADAFRIRRDDDG